MEAAEPLRHLQKAALPCPPALSRARITGHFRWGVQSSGTNTWCL